MKPIIPLVAIAFAFLFVQCSDPEAEASEKLNALAPKVEQAHTAESTSYMAALEQYNAIEQQVDSIISQYNETQFVKGILADTVLIGDWKWSQFSADSLAELTEKAGAESDPLLAAMYLAERITGNFDRSWALSHLPLFLIERGRTEEAAAYIPKAETLMAEEYSEMKLFLANAALELDDTETTKRILKEIAETKLSDLSRRFKIWCLWSAAGLNDKDLMKTFGDALVAEEGESKVASYKVYGSALRGNYDAAVTHLANCGDDFSTLLYLESTVEAFVEQKEFDHAINFIKAFEADKKGKLASALAPQLGIAGRTDEAIEIMRANFKDEYTWAFSMQRVCKAWLDSGLVEPVKAILPDMEKAVLGGIKNNYQMFDGCGLWAAVGEYDNAFAYATKGWGMEDIRYARIVKAALKQENYEMVTKALGKMKKSDNITYLTTASDVAVAYAEAGKTEEALALLDEVSKLRLSEMGDYGQTILLPELIYGYQICGKEEQVKQFMDDFHAMVPANSRHTQKDMFETIFPYLAKAGLPDYAIAILSTGTYEKAGNDKAYAAFASQGSVDDFFKVFNAEGPEYDYYTGLTYLAESDNWKNPENTSKIQEHLYQVISKRDE